MFFSYLHEISLVFPIFPAFFAIFPRFPQVFPRFSPGFHSLPGFAVLRCASRHLQGLAEESKRRIEATGWAWHQVLNVAKEATLQEVKQLGDESNGL
jgi:hypothetical protein